MDNKTFHVWEGVYKDFKSAPVVGRGHEGEKWLEVAVKRTKKLLEESKIPGAVSEVGGFRENLLPFLVAIVGSANKKVTILDFGGALGITYVPTKVVKSGYFIDYHIVELPKVAQEGKKLFEKDPHIHFHINLPKKLNNVNIVNIGSSIQYVEDWSGLLKKLASYKPKFFLMTQIFTGDVPTYVTVQNYYESQMAFWFISLKELILVMQKLGYELTFKSRFLPVFLGKEQEYPQDNFPEKYRLKRACNLLFVKKGA